MPTRGPNADDMIASLMQEMGQQQGYQDENSVAPTQANGSDNIESQRNFRRRQIQELSAYPDNTYKAGSQSIWNPLAMGECGSSRTTMKQQRSRTAAFLLPTNPRIEVTRRRVFEKFRQEVQILLQEFQTKNLSFLSSVPGDSSSFSKNKNKLPIPSMIEKWHMDAKLEERNSLLTKTIPITKGDSEYTLTPLSLTSDILRERARRKQQGKPIYDPILLNKNAPQIFVNTILKPQVQKFWQQVRSGTSQNSPMPPKFNKKAQQVEKGLYRLICEAVDSFESQLLQCAREESTRSTATKKNRRGSHSANKRPKISLGQGEDDDSSVASMVRVTFSGVTLKLHRAYLEKLQRLYDRTEDRRERGKDAENISSSFHYLAFDEALFCLLCRYDMIQGAGLQAGVPGAIMDVLLGRFDCRMECFASPFNCRYDCFASAFEDVDTPFGSRGSFFELPAMSDDDNSQSIASIETGICFEANPPFCDGLILQLDQKITDVLLQERKTPIMFAVFVPAWRDSDCYKALLANQCLTKHILLKQGEHWYAEGTQHRRKESFRVASFDTSILFYQNAAAQNLWNLQKDDNPVFSELKEAFGQNPGDMQKEEKPVAQRLKKLEEKVIATNLLTRVDPHSEPTCQSFSEKNSRKQAIKQKKNGRVKRRQLNDPKEEGKAQLALLESLGLSSATATNTTNPKSSEAGNSGTSGKINSKKKKRRKK